MPLNTQKDLNTQSSSKSLPCNDCGSVKKCDCTIDDLLSGDCSGLGAGSNLILSFDCDTKTIRFEQLTDQIRGWSPSFAAIQNDGASEGTGTQIGLKFVQWVGGTGIPPSTPTAPNVWLTPTGFGPIASATDFGGGTGHSQNTDTGTTSPSFSINTAGDPALINTSLLGAPRQYELPNASGTIALTSDLHAQNTDTGTTSPSFTINAAGDPAIINTSLLGSSRQYELPDASGTIALLSDIPSGFHAQNTDTGTTAATWIINSGGSSATIDTSALTSARVYGLQDKAGTLAMTNDPEYIYLQFEDGTSAAVGDDIAKIRFARAGTLTVINAGNFVGSNAGSYSTDNGNTWDTITTSDTITLNAPNTIVWFRGANGAGASVYLGGGSSDWGTVTITLTPN